MLGSSDFNRIDSKPLSYHLGVLAFSVQNMRVTFRAGSKEEAREAL
jgi:hypothetical protein